MADCDGKVWGVDGDESHFGRSETAPEAYTTSSSLVGPPLAAFRRVQTCDLKCETVMLHHLSESYLRMLAVHHLEVSASPTDLARDHNSTFST